MQTNICLCVGEGLGGYFLGLVLIVEGQDISRAGTLVSWMFQSVCIFVGEDQTVVA